MSEYKNDADYGKDDFGTYCGWCGDWVKTEYQQPWFCSDMCEDISREAENYEKFAGSEVPTGRSNGVHGAGG